MFMDEDFLLSTEWARRLYHGHAEGQPIVDYHCHLNPQQAYEDARFDDLTQVWLFDNGAGDHYKWRLMRANGVPEKLITGDGDPYEKFLAYVRTMERALGNPLYEWSHLELRRAFGIDLTICEKSAPGIWRRANERIAQPDFSARSLIRSSGVRCICTTDDPASDLAWHKKLAAEKDPGFKMLPTFRPDTLMAVEAPGFSTYARQLSKASGVEVAGWASLKAAVAQRVQEFHDVGGRLADHGLNTFRFVPSTDEQLAAIVTRALSGEPVPAGEADAYRIALPLFLMGEYGPFNRSAFVSDVVSWNLYLGWYVPGLWLNDLWFGFFHLVHPNRTVGMSEYGCEAMPNLHSERPRRGDHSEEYQCVYHEYMLRFFDRHPYLWVTHVWNMFDFAADARNQGGEPGMNHKGLVTFDRKTKKDAFYLYKCWWNPEPMVHICSKRFRDRARDRIRVKVYSSQPQVTLAVNGKEVATKACDKVGERSYQCLE